MSILTFGLSFGVRFRVRVRVRIKVSIHVHLDLAKEKRINCDFTHQHTIAYERVAMGVSMHNVLESEEDARKKH